MEVLLMAEITYRTITDVNDAAFAGFADVYIKAFAGPPYYETFTPDYIREHVWEPHIKNGCIVVAEADGKVVGVAGGYPLPEGLEPKIFDFLGPFEDWLPFPFEETIYMSELAVDEAWRHRGIATRLVLERMRWATENGCTHYTMRTAHEGSNSKPLYEKLGAQEVPGLIQDTRVHPGEPESASTFRIYLYGSLEAVLED